MDIRFSCDDGDKLDLRVADILDKYGFRGIFYIAPFRKSQTILKVKEIRELAKKHEIGGHTLNHALLTRLSDEKAKKEIADGKRELETLINKQVNFFAYPKGWFDERIKRLVKESGFTEARTMKLTQASLEDYDKYEVPITAHLYPRKEYEYKGIYRSILDEFDQSKEKGYFQLVVHSKELQEYNLWLDFEKIVEYIKLNK